MYLEWLQLRDFRNVAQAELAFGPTLNLIGGTNGQGKSNLLEAIGLLVTGRSFRRAPSAVMRRHNQPWFRLNGQIHCTDLVHKIDFFGLEERNSVQLNGKSLPTLSALGQVSTAVICTPDSLRLIKGAPLERRNFIDWITLQYHRHHATLIQQYQHALKSRHKLIQSGQHESIELDAWEQQLAIIGSSISLNRRSTLQRLLPHLSRSLQALTLAAPRFHLEIHGVIEQHNLPLQQTDIIAHHRQLLYNSRHRDRYSGITSVGPHREDLLFLLDGLAVARFASQGEQRRFLLALKLAEAALLSEIYSSPPLFLLDEPTTELDQEGVALLMEWLAVQGHQLFLATCHPQQIPWSGPSARAFTTTTGVFQPVV
ncbi:MAG: DNA replication and repair protein RecF [Magnetococcales bacterium]|nr:DNA replication and repair protein RecF [Magnetococcales bacterium]